MLLTSVLFSAVAAAAAADGIAPKNLSIDNSTSILGVAKTLAQGVMSYYTGNATTYADLPDPYYWWECGAMLGAMLDYSYDTNDTTYDDIIATAIMANTGPTYDFMVPKHRLDEGNDDQAFWAFTVLSAAEHNFTRPANVSPDVPSYLDMSINIWNSMVVRWNTTMCNGGFTWQIFADNYNGLNYKNSASNGGFFLISARLALLTGNQTYVDWATKVWDWTKAIGMIADDYTIYDGTDSAENCSSINPLSFTYQNGIFLYGAAALANQTGSPAWTARAEGILGASAAFFSPFKNATDIMWEHACEGVGTCTTDMKSFKGILSRFMYASSVVMPSLAHNVTTYMRASSKAAAQACTGPDIDGAPSANGTTCGQKWYVGGFDGSVGLGQEMCALETIQGLLLLDTVLRQEGENPDGSPITTTTTSTPTPTLTPTPSPTTASATASPSKNASVPGVPTVDLRWTILSVACALLVWGMM